MIPTRPATPSTLALAAGLALAGAAPAAHAETLRQLASVQIVSNVPFANQLASARSLGMKRVRLAVRWDAVERPRGRDNWRPFDDKIRALTHAGIAPIIVIHGGNRGYSSPRSQGASLAGFARFAGAVAARYGTGTPDLPILYEIWNEPNTKTFWGAAPDPEGYARMAEAACGAIRAQRPGARVLALGMEGTPVKTPYFVPAYNIDIYQQWAARAATPGLMRCADGFSMHPYLPSPEYQLRDDAKLRAFVAQHWSRPAPPMIANTEVGYPINATKGVGADDQAALDLRALLIGAGQGRVTNLYQSVDGSRDTSKPANSYGLVSYDGRIKPAGFAVRRLLRAIGDYRVTGVGAVPGTPAGAPGVYRFTAENGPARAAVLWTIAKPARTRVPPRATALDPVAGTPVAIAPDGTIAVGPRPVLVTWPG